MDRLRLTLATWDYDRVRPLIDGSIQPEGIELAPIISRPSETFFRMLRHQEFDVSELSFSNYTMLRAGGDDKFVAIPVFPSRLFRHSCIYVNKKAGINEPKDLIGKKIGVPEYSMTAAVFARGMLLHEYGVTPDSIEWFSGTQDGLQRPSRIDFVLPESVVLHRMPLEQDMGPMLDSGELDAIISPNAPRSLHADPSPVRRLFTDYRQAEKDYFSRTGIFPIMHTIVFRREGVRGQPVGRHEPIRSLHQGEAVGVRPARRDRCAEAHAPVGRGRDRRDPTSDGTRLLGVRHRAEPRIVRGVAAVSARTELDHPRAEDRGVVRAEHIGSQRLITTKERPR